MLKKAKKSLGQNFLKTKSVVYEIIKTANLNSKDIVLEAGPGKGILTQSLLQTAGKVIAVEKDDNLILLLQKEFAKEIKNDKLALVKGDILDFDFKKYGLKNGNYKIVANIPYYITSKFLRKTLSSDIQPSKMVLLLQKEVAERIAKSGKESILSISVKAYGEPKYVKTVKAGNFNPAPKVDSAILFIDNISREFFTEHKGRSFVESFNGISEEYFFKIVKTGFAHKRKFLISNLRDFMDKENLEKIFERIKINKKTRAENLSVEEWGEFAQALYEMKN